MTVQFNSPYSTIFDANGKPVSGATAEFFISGTTSPVTWSIRVGGAFTFNGSSGTNTLGGAVKSYMRIRELGAF